MTHQERQREQSREWIAEAFFGLLQKKRFEAVTISEIVKKADLSRRTFYRVFDSKQDILLYRLEKIMPEYIALLAQLPERKREPLAGAVVAFVDRHLDFFRCLQENHLDYMILDFFDSRLYEGRDAVWGGPFCEDPEVERIFLKTISVEHYNIIRLRLDMCRDKTPEEMAGLISDALALFQHFN